ncbi:hypothetical protein ACEF11_01060 [[Pasteurella] aerogenes]
MKKLVLILFTIGIIVGCTTIYKQDYTTKPVYCYQLTVQEQQPGKNCIGSGGH